LDYKTEVNMNKKEFIVGGNKVTRDSREEVVLASTREEAIEQFRALHPGHPIDFVEGDGKSFVVIGQDEGTGEYIFEGDEYCCDSEGIMWLPDENGSCGCDDKGE
jgi:hypothetical protein